MKLTTQELETQTLSAESLSTAAQLIRTNGYVIFESVFPADFVAAMYAEFTRLFEAYVARTDPNRGANRYQMHLPFAAPFSDPAVITNALALPVIDEILGKDNACTYFASDTPMPGSDYQQVHSDIAALFPEMPLSLPAYCLVVNIPLVDFTEENGPLEAWPGGTHLMPGGVDIQALAPLMKSEHVLMPAGSLLIRDLRMWHRGTPNNSQGVRPNVALIYNRPWLKQRYPQIEIPQETYDGLSERGKQLFRFEKIG